MSEKALYIEKRIPGFPIVLHGASSVVPSTST